MKISESLTKSSFDPALPKLPELLEALVGALINEVASTDKEKIGSDIDIILIIYRYLSLHLWWGQIHEQAGIPELLSSDDKSPYSSADKLFYHVFSDVLQRIDTLKFKPYDLVGRTTIDYNFSDTIRLNTYQALEYLTIIGVGKNNETSIIRDWYCQYYDKNKYYNLSAYLKDVLQDGLKSQSRNFLKYILLTIKGTEEFVLSREDLNLIAKIRYNFSKDSKREKICTLDDINYLWQEHHQPQIQYFENEGKFPELKYSLIAFKENVKLKKALKHMPVYRQDFKDFRDMKENHLQKSKTMETVLTEFCHLPVVLFPLIRDFLTNEFMSFSVRASETYQLWLKLKDQAPDLSTLPEINSLIRYHREYNKILKALTEESTYTLGDFRNNILFLESIKKWNRYLCNDRYFTNPIRALIWLIEPLENYIMPANERTRTEDNLFYYFDTITTISPPLTQLVQQVAASTLNLTDYYTKIRFSDCFWLSKVFRRLPCILKAGSSRTAIVNYEKNLNAYFKKSKFGNSVIRFIEVSADNSINLYVCNNAKNAIQYLSSLSESESTIHFTPQLMKRLLKPSINQDYLDDKQEKVLLNKIVKFFQISPIVTLEYCGYYGRATVPSSALHNFRCRFDFKRFDFKPTDQKQIERSIKSLILGSIGRLDHYLTQKQTRDPLNTLITFITDFKSKLTDDICDDLEAAARYLIANSNALIPILEKLSVKDERSSLFHSSLSYVIKYTINQFDDLSYEFSALQQDRNIGECLLVSTAPSL